MSAVRVPLVRDPLQPGQQGTNQLLERGRGKTEGDGPGCAGLQRRNGPAVPEMLFGLCPFRRAVFAPPLCRAGSAWTLTVRWGCSLCGVRTKRVWENTPNDRRRADFLPAELPAQRKSGRKVKRLGR